MRRSGNGTSLMSDDDTITVYRYDTREFADDEEMTSNGDHFEHLNEDEKLAETAIRDHMENGHLLRSSALYTWKHLEMAEFGWKAKKNMYLYELRVDKADILHTGDLQEFTNINRALRKNESADIHLKNYACGICSTTRIEILASKAAVVSCLRVPKTGRDANPV